MCAWGRISCIKQDNRLEKRAVAGPFTGAVEGVDRGDGPGVSSPPCDSQPFPDTAVVALASSYVKKGFRRTAVQEQS